MTFEHLVLSRSGALSTITLDWPEKRNPLSRQVLAELTAAVRVVGDSDALGLVVAANGPVFSAGHDFGELSDASLPEARQLFQACTELLDAIQSIPQPVCARVHALATGAGCQLVASCDLAVAADTASFAIPGGKGGLFCHTPLVAVARNVGRKRALEMAFTGDPIDAVTAAEWGLVNRVVPAAELDAAVEELLERCTRGSAFSKGFGKQTFYAQIGLDQRAAYALAIEAMAAAAVGADAQEAIAAFFARRH